MRVAFCIRKDYNSKIGGDTIQCINTKENLERQFNTRISIITDAAELEKEFDIVHIFNLATPAETKNFFLKAKSLDRPKIVLSPIFWNYKYAAVKDLARLLNYSIPTNEFHSAVAVAIASTVATILGKPWILSNSFRNFSKECLTVADFLLPNSGEELQELAKFTGISYNNLSEKSQVVVNASKFSKPTDDMEDFFGGFKLPDDFVLQVGRIEFTKNQLNVVRALYNHPEIPIVFIGRNNDAIYEKKLRNLSSSRGNVYFIEQVPNEKIFAFYKKAALHILPSFRESPGLVSLEALSQQCKIVVADKRFTPVETYFGTNATVINPSSIKSIRAGILKELSTQRNMETIRDEIMSKFTWENAAKSTYEGYQKLMTQ